MNLIDGATQKKFIKFNHSMPQGKIFLQPKNSAFSKSLIVIKCFKYLICVLLSTEYGRPKSLIENRRKDKNGLVTPS